jgi:hypothetical protein
MTRTIRSTAILAACVTLITGAACRDATAPAAPNRDLIPLPLSTIAVSVSTSGTDVDPDGYIVTVDGASSKALSANGQVLFLLLSLGNHTVALSGVAENCVVDGANPRIVEALLGILASTHYSVSCKPKNPPPPPPPPEKGSVTVTTATSGTDVDADGYTVTLDGGASQPISTNGTVTFNDVPVGDHSVTLSGVAANCSVDAANPQTVTVTAGNTASANFPVSCTGGGGGGVVRIAGVGKILTAGGVVITFDFDVASDLTGHATASDSSDVRPDGTVGTLRVDPSDPATSFTAFRASSSTCSDPSRGAEFDGIGREDTGGLVAFTFIACDLGPAGSGQDIFRGVIPSEEYDRRGPVTAGDIVKSGP